MNDNVKTILLWLFAFSLIFLLVNIFMHAETKITDISFKQFIEQGEKGNIAKVEMKGQNIKGEFISPFVKNNSKFEKFVTVVPADYPDIVNKILSWRNLEDFNVVEDKESTFMTVLISWAPLIVLIVIWVMFMKQMQGGGAKALSFGKSKARLVDNKKITFKDVAGVDEAIEELKEVVEFLKNPKKFQKLGGKIPKGVLLMGPPGTGKTLLAKAVAGEAGVPFFSISGSEFVEMFVGVGASRVRDLFEQGKKNAPCIIFIDELDAVGRHRGAGLGGGHDEREQTLNQLLVEMDGFETKDGVILIAATNRPDVLDPALLRPGRFDRRIVVDRPDVRGREAILKIHTRNIPLGEDVDLKIIARSTPGFAGAELANLVNEAALLAARKDKELVEMEDFEEAKDKVIMGLARKSMAMSDDEKKNTAYHEAGHALVAALLPGADPIHKVTIIPRGRALGVTVQLPEDDRYTYTKDYLENRIAILMGGRVAEEVYMGHITTGAGNDIEVATDLARKMVCKWGMSELGPLNLGVEEQEIFLGKDLVKHQNYSNDTAKLIDTEIKNIIMRNYKKAKDLLTKYEKEFLELANKLLEKEVLTAEEVYSIVRGESKGDLSPEPQQS
ncbi:cell division protease FtsH [Thermotomaculum hydrothermale]|uniref:ATP-dependent zinc metalloprotease FtsH n=1 Tax=Thermotomaculum hydrothermale TaxID=981385 RepID=A0A7R6PNX0_9BACT|nr:ATP-dependent zinc metalloprotease FtsH [Thermotomaculum hydrothermale]BBB32586.1 cell division protease FtsH [Thermotomaculum hydrothermale]